MPERVLLQPAEAEYGAHRERYEALVDDLEARGVLVRLLPRLERRSGFPGSVPTPGEEYDLVVHVGELAGARVGTGTLFELLHRRLRRTTALPRAPRRAKVYLATGEEHELALDVRTTCGAD